MRKNSNGVSWVVWRYIDDGIFPHSANVDGSCVLKGIYPTHLTWEWVVKNSVHHIVFPDL